MPQICGAEANVRAYVYTSESLRSGPRLWALLRTAMVTGKNDRKVGRCRSRPSPCLTEQRGLRLRGIASAGCLNCDIYRRKLGLKPKVILLAAASECRHRRTSARGMRKGSASWKADAPVLSSLIDGGISSHSSTRKLGLNHDVARIVAGDPFQVSFLFCLGRFPMT